MTQPFLALITPLSGTPGVPTHPIQPPSGTPGHPIYIPDAPPYAPGSPSHPIYITGSPSHPIYIPGYPDHPIVPPGGSPSHPIFLPGAPDQSLPGGQPYPDQGLPGSQPRPDQGLPSGGYPVPPTVWPTGPVPPLPPELASQLVVAVHRPGQEWEVKAYPIGPSHPMQPTNTPVPKK